MVRAEVGVVEGSRRVRLLAVRQGQTLSEVRGHTGRDQRRKQRRPGAGGNARDGGGHAQAVHSTHGIPSTMIRNDLRRRQIQTC